MWFHSKGHIFYLKDCVSLPTLVRIFVGSIDSCFLTHTKKYMTTIHASLFKNISKCVFIKYILKRQCQLSTLWGSMYSKKELAGSSFVENPGVPGCEARKPWQELKGSALDRCPLLFCGVSRLITEFMQYHQKASVKIQH